MCVCVSLFYACVSVSRIRLHFRTDGAHTLTHTDTHQQHNNIFGILFIFLSVGCFPAAPRKAAVKVEKVEKLEKVEETSEGEKGEVADVKKKEPEKAAVDDVKDKKG